MCVLYYTPSINTFGYLYFFKFKVVSPSEHVFHKYLIIKGHNEHFKVVWY